MSDFQHDTVYDHILGQAALELNVPVQEVEDLIRSEYLRLVSLATGQVIGGYFYTPGQAAELLGQDAFEINIMIHHEQLPKVLVYNQRWIPVQPVENLMSESAQQEPWSARNSSAYAI